jgi:MFS family permease
MVAAAFTVGFVVFGVLYSFGAFFAPMTEEFAASRSAASAFFAITGLIFYFAGPVTGHLGDRLGPRPMVGLGALLIGGGLSLTALSGDIRIGYLTYGIGVGVGCACAYTPSLAIVGGWFVRQRTAALGVAAAGTGCGTLVLPPLAAILIADYGWRAACVMLGGGCGLLLLAATAIVRPAPLATIQAPQPLGRSVRSIPFVLLYVSWVCATTALFVPFVFLPAFARQHGADPVAAAALLSLVGAMSVAGRLGIGVLAERFGTLRLFKAAVFMMAASYLLWLPFTGYGWLAVFAAVLGLGYGIRIALMPAVLIEFFGLARLGTLLGIFFTASGIAAFLGPMAAAAIIDRTGDYDWGIGFALAMGVLGLIALLPLRITPAA